MEIILDELQAQCLKNLIQERRELNQAKEKQLKLLKRSLITAEEFTEKISELVKRQEKNDNLVTAIIMNNI